MRVDVVVKSAIVALLSSAAMAHAVPVRLNHQGRFEVDKGFPLEGDHMIKVALYDAPEGGSLMWTATYAVDLVHGYYGVTLGGDPVNPLDSEILAQYPLFLGVTLDDGEEMAPRQEVVSVPYSILSDTSVSVDGGYADVDYVNINGAPVIDGGGHWVGPEIYDGTDFALSSQSCPAGQVVAGIAAVGTLSCVEAVAPGHYLPLGSTTACGGTDKVVGLDPSTGNVVCAADVDSDTDTTYSAGDGLQLNGTVFRVEPGRYLPVGPGTACAGTAKVTGIDVVTGNVICGPDIDTDTDANTTYSAGDGLELNGTVFRVQPGRFLPVGATIACAGSDKVIGFDPATGNVLCGHDVDTDTDTDTNTTYTAGDGLQLNGTVFRVQPGRFLPVGPTTACAGSDKVVGLDAATGNVVCAPDVDTDTDSTYAAGDGLALAGNVFSVEPGRYLPLGAAVACNGSDKVVGFDPASGNVLCGADVDTDTDTDTNTTYSAGDGLVLDGTVFRVEPGRYLPVGGATACTGTDKVVGIEPGTGDVLCGTDVDTDTDTTYVAGNALLLTGNVFSVQPGRFYPIGPTTSCAAGQKVIGLDATTGNMLCAVDVDTDTNTTYSAGPGLLLAGTTFRVDFGPGGTSNQAVRYDDPRLSDARPPAPGSNNYIQNQTAGAQAAGFWISGNGTINGTLQVNGGRVFMAGKEAIQGTAGDGWLRLNQAGHFTSGVHTPGNFAPGQLNVGGANGWGDPGAGNMWVNGASTLYGDTTMNAQVTMNACRICFYYGDTGGSSGQKTMCIKMVPGSASGWMNLHGDVDDNDIVQMKYLCDGGAAGVFNGWPAL